MNLEGLIYKHIDDHFFVGYFYKFLPIIVFHASKQQIMNKLLYFSNK